MRGDNGVVCAVLCDGGVLSGVEADGDGGTVFGGGIPPKILPLLQTDNWTKNFDNNGRMHELSDKVPVHVVLNDKMALLGARIMELIICD